MSTSISHSHLTSLSLLCRASDGEPLAWQELVQLYGPIVYAWIRRTGVQAADAADIMQETLAVVVTQMARFDATQTNSTFRGWLWTITRNKCVDFQRRQNRQPIASGGSSMQQRLNQFPALETESALASDDPPSELAVDRAAVCRRALANLRSRFEPQTWQAFWRTTVDGCAVDDVAAELQMNRWSVYKARSRVLNRLREHLTGLEELP